MHSESADFLGGLRPVRHRGQEEQVRSMTKFDSICENIRLIAVIKVGSRVGPLHVTHYCCCVVNNTGIFSVVLNSFLIEHMW